MPTFLVRRFVRQLSGLGALDNVDAVLEARASVAAEIDAFVARVEAHIPVAPATPAAA